MRCIAISISSPSASQPPTGRLSNSYPTSNYKPRGSGPSTRSTTPEWDLQSDVSDANDRTYGEEQQTSQSLGFYSNCDSHDSDDDDDDDDSELIRPPELKKARFVVTRRDNVAICEDCHYAVIASKIPGHILYTHQAPTALANEVRQAIEALGIRETTDPPKPLNKPLPLIEVEQGWRCTATGCSFAALQKKTLKSHVCSTHPRKDGYATAASLMMPYPVQQVFHSSRQFWAVDLSGSRKISATDGVHSMVLRLRDQERNIRANIITTPNNNRLIYPLLTLLGWDSLVDGQDGDLLQSLVSGGADTEWAAVGDVNRAYFDQLRPIVRNFCVNSLFWIASPKLYDPASCPACMFALNYLIGTRRVIFPFITFRQSVVKSNMNAWAKLSCALHSVCTLAINCPSPFYSATHNSNALRHCKTHLVLPMSQRVFWRIMGCSHRCPSPYTQKLMRIEQRNSGMPS